MNIELTDDQVREAKSRIHAFLEETYEENAGEIKTRAHLDFFLRELAPYVYNQAIRDACTYMQDKTILLEQDYFVPEK